MRNPVEDIAINYFFLVIILLDREEIETKVLEILNEDTDLFNEVKIHNDKYCNISLYDAYDELIKPLEKEFGLNLLFTCFHNGLYWIHLEQNEVE